MNGREAGESGLWLKASVSPEAGVRETNANASVRRQAPLRPTPPFALDRRVVAIGMLHHNCLKVKRTVCESGSPAGLATTRS